LRGGAVIALGLFDGVHRGHRLLLDTAKKIARERSLTFTVFTFSTESLAKCGGALYSTEEKLELLEEAGVEAVILADFKEMADVSAEEFVKRLLVCEMGCEVAVCGFDFRFGKGAAGNAKIITALMTELGKEAVIEEEHTICGEKISTTKIKALLGEGDVKSAAEFLGAPYFITATVEHGRGEGRSLGFPTANLSSCGLYHLRRGVYSCIALIEGRLLGGVVNVGTCPTFDEREVHAEVHLDGTSEDLYGKKLRIFFTSYIRGEKRFNNAEELIKQINVDKLQAKRENGVISWQVIGPK
jgi:riboflavin kinase/FMN adenylyltransferase